jgi:hypothetical protein
VSLDRAFVSWAELPSDKVTGADPPAIDVEAIIMSKVLLGKT